MAKASDEYGTYGNVPTVEPTNVATPNMRVEATPNDFGAQIGKAVENAGTATFDTANHLQDIYNDSLARDAVVANSQKLGDAENEYRQNRGINAPAAYKSFQEKANQIYENGAAAMPNPMAQKLFRDQFSRETSYSLKSAGAWAADQAEQGYVTSLNSSMTNKVNQFAMAPTDPARRAELASSIRDDALQYAHFKGLDSETADQLVSHNIGEGYSVLIKSAAQSDPALATSLYQEAANGKFTATTVNSDGTKTDREIPYLDAAHRGTIATEMSTEFNRQFKEQYDTSMNFAKMGIPIDKSSFVITAKNAGHNDAFINSQLQRMDQVQQKFATEGAQYDVNKVVQADASNAMIGAPVQGDYDPAMLATAYPNNPAKVQEVTQQGEMFKQVATEVGTFTTKTPAEIFASVEKYNPQAVPSANTSASGSVPIPNFQLTKNIDDNEAKLPNVISNASGGDPNLKEVPSSGGNTAATINPQQKQLYDTMKTAATQYVQQLYQDPAGVLTSKDKVLTALMDDAVKDPSKLAPYVAASLKQQIAVGVPENLRTALPISVATNYVKNITANPVGAADTFSKLEQQTGKNWPDVYHSLVTRGQLPVNYQVIAQLNEETSTQKDASLLSKWYSEDPEGKLTNGLISEKGVQDIKKTILSNSNMTQLQQSLANSGSSRNNIAAINHSIEDLAAANVFYNRTDPKTAASQAADAYASRYEYMEKGNARVPTKYFDTVNENANSLMSNLEESAVPPAIYNAKLPGTAMTPQGYFNYVKASHTWVTSPNEDAIMLKDGQNKYVNGKDGKPISVPFNNFVTPSQPKQPGNSLGIYG